MQTGAQPYDTGFFLKMPPFAPLNLAFATIWCIQKCEGDTANRFSEIAFLIFLKNWKIMKNLENCRFSYPRQPRKNAKDKHAFLFQNWLCLINTFHLVPHTKNFTRPFSPQNGNNTPQSLIHMVARLFRAPHTARFRDVRYFRFLLSQNYDIELKIWSCYATKMP